MNSFGNVKEFFISVLERFKLAWWVEIVTNTPRCTYYFGPFLSRQEAKSYQPGYIEDLESEGTRIVSVEVMQGQPKELTSCDREF
jgi:hypothetical protein